MDGPTANVEDHAFIEMRDKTATKTFRAKKKLDHLLEATLPGIYLPLYTMVTFTRIPYAQAAQRAQRQDRTLYATLIAAAIIEAIASLTASATDEHGFSRIGGSDLETRQSEIPNPCLSVAICG